MKRSKGNIPNFAKYINKGTNKANSRDLSDKAGDESGAKGQSMKNSNMSHRTCK